MAEGLTEDDNIIYELTDREIELSEDILGERITKIVLSYEYLDDSNDSADISVIAYAVAAISGLGALVIAKKR